MEFYREGGGQVGLFRERGGGVFQRGGWTGGSVLEREGVEFYREGGGQVGLF